MSQAHILKRITPRLFWPYLGAVRRWVRAAPPRPLLQKRRLLRDPSLSPGDRELLERVSSRIYFNDGMYAGDGAEYYKVGLSAIHCIDEAVERAKLARVRTILDLPCGSGRVMRFLVQRFPEAEITATELEPGPMNFCARTFGARPALSQVHLDEVSLGREFDLIWCGSLITHLNQQGIRTTLSLFKRHLSPGGLVIFTSHGDFVAERIPSRDFDYLLAEDQIDRIALNYWDTGYKFEDYPEQKDWGISLTSPEWIRAQVRELGGLREVFFKPRGWDNHQDVFGFVAE